MTRVLTKSRTLAALMSLAALSTACGSAADGTYPGEPLATLRGTLTASGQAQTVKTVRLALAWYPGFASLGGGGGGVKSIVTQDVQYQGSFPLNWTFDLYGPPPADAIVDFSSFGGPKKAAIGVLLAYEDLNGNGKLDTIPTGGTAIDRVLGSSLNIEDNANQGAEIIYIEGDPGPDAAGMKEGFNLMVGPDAKPLDTPVTIALDPKPSLNLTVCESFVGGIVDGEAVCGVDLTPELFVSGTAVLQDGKSLLQIFLGGKKATDAATITLDGTAVPSKKEDAYEIETTSALLRPSAQHTVSVMLPGETSARSYTFAMPGDFAISSPTAEATLSSKQPLNLSWGAAAGAFTYSVDVVSDTGSGQFHADTEKTSATVDLKDFSGGIQITISAQKLPMPDDGQTSAISGTITHRLHANVAP